jgi:hypothetical protein
MKTFFNYLTAIVFGIFVFYWKSEAPAITLACAGAVFMLVFLYSIREYFEA